MRGLEAVAYVRTVAGPAAPPFQSGSRAISSRRLNSIDVNADPWIADPPDFKEDPELIIIPKEIKSF